MLFPSSTSSAARTSLVYITIGALVMIWTGVWYVFLHNNPPTSHSVYYWCAGFGVTGLTMFIIGLGVGRIGYSARAADLPQAVGPPAVATDANGQPAAVVPVVAPPAATAAAPVAAPPAVMQQQPAVLAGRRG
jgi:hypothetical protein